MGANHRKISNQFNLATERIANATSDRFDRIEERLDELTSHFGRIQDQLHALCEDKLGLKAIRWKWSLGISRGIWYSL